MVTALFGLAIDFCRDIYGLLKISTPFGNYKNSSKLE
jgi:hypothetical protein